MRRGVFRIVARKQTIDQALAVAAVGQRKDILVVASEIAPRPFQNAGKRKIVSGIERDLHQRQAILHREFVAQHHAIGAGDGELLALERLDQLAEHRPALTHQRQHIAGAHGSKRAFFPHRLARFDHRLDVFGDALRQHDMSAALALQVHRRIPRLGVGDSRLRRQRPHFDDAALVRARRQVNRFVVRAEAGHERLALHRLVDSAQNFGR